MHWRPRRGALPREHRPSRGLSTLSRLLAASLLSCCAAGDFAAEDVTDVNHHPGLHFDLAHAAERIHKLELALERFYSIDVATQSPRALAEAGANVSTAATTCRDDDSTVIAATGYDCATLAAAGQCDLYFCASCAYAGTCDASCGLCSAETASPSIAPTGSPCTDDDATVIAATGYDCATLAAAGQCDVYFCASCAYAGTCDASCGLCSAETESSANKTACSVVDVATDWIDVSQSNHIGTITTTASNYELSFEMEITGDFEAWGNILTIGGDSVRMPWIGFSSTTYELHVKQAQSGGYRDQYGPDSVSAGLVQGGRYNITIRCMHDIMSVLVDGDLKSTESGTATYASPDAAAVYASDLWHGPANVRLRSIVYTSDFLSSGCPSPAPTSSPFPTVPPSSATPTVYNPCPPDNDAVMVALIGYDCSTLAALGYCDTEFCPSCSNAGQCDTSCGFCSISSAVPTASPSVAPSGSPCVDDDTTVITETGYDCATLAAAGQCGVYFCASCAYAGTCDASCGLCSVEAASPSVAPTVSPCTDDDTTVVATAGYDCATLAAAGQCDVYFCASCAYAGTCDASCGLCSVETESSANITACSVVKVATDWIDASQSNHIGTIATASNYELSFEMEITGDFEAWGNILTIGDDAVRMPWIGFSSTAYELHVKQAQSDGYRDQYGPDSVSAGLVPGGRYNITIRCMDDNLSVFVDGELKSTDSGTATYATLDSAAAVYASDLWHGPANVRLRSIVYTSDFMSSGCPSPAPTASPFPTVPPPSATPTVYNPCPPDNDDVVEASIGFTCAALAGAGYCDAQFCPACSYAGLCDTSCGFCSMPTAIPTASPFPSIATTPMPTVIPTVTPLPTPVSAAPTTWYSCGTVHLAPDWIDVSQSNQIGTIATASDYELSFEMEIIGEFVAWGNILRIGDHAYLKMPWIGFSENGGELHIRHPQSTVNDDNYGPWSLSAGIVQGGTYNITVRCLANTMSVYVDGELKTTESGYDTYFDPSHHFAVYAGDPWHAPANVRLRSIVYSTQNSGFGCPTSVPTSLPIPTPTAVPTPPPTPTTELNIAPESLSLTAPKPGFASGTAYLVNPNDQVMTGTIRLRETTLPSNAAWSVTPDTFTVAPGDIQTFDVTADSTGLAPQAYTMVLELVAQTSNSLPVNQSFVVNLVFTARADASTTHVMVRGSPTLDVSWKGVEIYPKDADGFAIITDRGETFDVSLASNASLLVAPCTTLWLDPIYQADCVVPDTSLAGDWALTVTLDGSRLVHVATVHPKCAAGKYEDPVDNQCKTCPPGSLCSSAGTTLAKLPLDTGHWRSGKSHAPPPLPPSFAGQRAPHSKLTIGL